MVTFGIVICHAPAKDNIFRNNDSCDAMVHRFLETEIPAAGRRLKSLASWKRAEVWHCSVWHFARSAGRGRFRCWRPKLLGFAALRLRKAEGTKVRCWSWSHGVMESWAWSHGVRFSFREKSREVETTCCNAHTGRKLGPNSPAQGLSAPER